MEGAASSDLGRRLRHRREELGYSVAETAAGASIDPGYLDYLEAAPSPDPSRATVVRLALALRTSAAGLLGGDEALPPGHDAQGTGTEPLDLDPATCLQLIAPGGVGRIVFDDVRGPVALPVNFGVLDGDIVFRTNGSTSVAAGAVEPFVSFEVDRIDDLFVEGWSVLVSGTAHPVEDPDERRAIEALGVRPWAGGTRDDYFRLEPELITGRQIAASPG